MQISANSISWFSGLVTMAATVVLAIATLGLWKATNQMARESREATQAYERQTIALDGVSKQINLLSGIITDSQDKRLQNMRSQVFWEMQRNHDQWRCNQTHELHFSASAWELYRDQPLFDENDPLETPYVDLLYSQALPLLEGKVRRGLDQSTVALDNQSLKWPNAANLVENIPMVLDKLGHKYKISPMKRK